MGPVTFPWTIEASRAGESLLDRVPAHRAEIEEHLLRDGAVLLRGFVVAAPAEFERVIAATCGELLAYRYRSTPRTLVEGNIYTSTEYPAGHSIPLHNENSYSNDWPARICFYCVQAAAQGGRTPIADSRKVLARIDPALRRRFSTRKVMYVRNYRRDLDLPWEEVFQTSDRSAIEEFCRRSGIVFEWREGGGLRTRQVCQAIARHPATSDEVWFNQAHLFHVSSLAPRSRAALQEMFAEDDLPRNAFYGDGGAIEESALDEIRSAYREETAAFAWKDGDILMLDNLLTAHGREPFRGPRKVLVGMAR